MYITPPPLQSNGLGVTSDHNRYSGWARMGPYSTATQLSATVPLQDLNVEPWPQSSCCRWTLRLGVAEPDSWDITGTVYDQQERHYDYVNTAHDPVVELSKPATCAP